MRTTPYKILGFYIWTGQPSPMNGRIMITDMGVTPNRYKQNWRIYHRVWGISFDALFFGFMAGIREAEDSNKVRETKESDWIPESVLESPDEVKEGN